MRRKIPTLLALCMILGIVTYLAGMGDVQAAESVGDLESAFAYVELENEDLKVTKDIGGGADATAPSEIEAYGSVQNLITVTVSSPSSTLPDPTMALEEEVIVMKGEGTAQITIFTSGTETQKIVTVTIRPELTEPETTPTEPGTTPMEPEVTPEEPEATPTEPEITPEEPEATPTEPEITPEEPEATPTEPEITPEEPETTPTEPEITPEEPEATPMEPEITPEEPETTPMEPAATPEEPETTPIESAATPEEPETTPTEPEITPTEPEITPEEPEATPEEPERPGVKSKPNPPVKRVQKIYANDLKKAYGSKAFSLGAKADGGGALSYEVMSPIVATVDGDGFVTLKGCGVTEIRIAAAAHGEYGAAVRTVTLTVVPQKLKGVSAKSTKSRSLAVRWKKDEMASGYIIECSSDQEFKENVRAVYVSRNQAAFKKIPKLKAGKKYYVRACAYVKVGRERISGAYGKAKRAVRIKKKGD